MPLAGQPVEHRGIHQDPHRVHGLVPGAAGAQGALPASWSTIHPAVVARCAVSCPATSASSPSVDAASNAARTSPADRSGPIPARRPRPRGTDGRCRP